MQHNPSPSLKALEGQGVHWARRCFVWGINTSGTEIKVQTRFGYMYTKCMTFYTPLNGLKFWIVTWTCDIEAGTIFSSFWTRVDNRTKKNHNSLICWYHDTKLTIPLSKRRHWYLHNKYISQSWLGTQKAYPLLYWFQRFLQCDWYAFIYYLMLSCCGWYCFYIFSAVCLIGLQQNDTFSQNRKH